MQADLTPADGHSERKVALEMIERHSPGSTRRLTLGADKATDCRDVITALRRMAVSLRVAQKSRQSAIDGRAIQHPGYTSCRRSRERIEAPLG